MRPRPLSRSRAPLFGWLVAIGVGQAIGAITVALLVERGFDLLVTGTAPVSALTAGGLAAGLIGGVVVTALLRRQETVVAERVGQAYIVDLRETLFEHLTRVPARELGQRSRGSMLLRFVGDLKALKTWVSLGLARLIVAGLAIGLATAALAVMNVRLGLAVGGILLLGALATWATTPRLLATAAEARKRQSRLTGEVSERLTQIAVLQASGQERRERNRVRRKSDHVATAMIARAKASGAARAIAEGTAALAGVTALIVGAYEVRAGRATAGTIVASLSIAGLLSGHLRDLGRVAEYAAGARVARTAVQRFLTMPPLPDPEGAPNLDASDGAVQIQAVSLGQALSAVTLHARAGETVAVVGSNGAGKSTLVGLVARMFDPDEGHVRIDGQDLRTRSLASVRRAVGMAGPDLPLMRGSMDRNVRYRLPRCSDEEVARIADLCELHQVASDLPDGWRSDVGELGGRLSAGQRARLTVARAALGRPSVLVLDEAEAHLDLDAANLVDRVLADHQGTALVITHRRELVERADTVWCLVGGRVAEVGHPARLLAGDGPTAQLFGPRGRPADWAGGFRGSEQHRPEHSRVDVGCSAAPDAGLAD